ncbi:hypothetical protein V5799_025197 [Amblyomma americanum]|uniref:RNA-directed DNA polymerase n=1 Tax=Amblyomma americanum TaxID=6943 RepID=A0AAQ4E9V8_AMBAM
MATDSRFPAPILYHTPRTPPSFRGDVYENAEDWLDIFERVARYNGWSDDRKLHNVYFALEDSARTWYENHEGNLSTWETFRQNLIATFPNADRREKAEAALRSRNQRTNESVRMYVEDMTRLFKRADPSMAEETKLRHLMRGVKQELFAGLVRSPPRTVAEFLTEATTMETTLLQRARQYNRDHLAKGMAVAFLDDVDRLPNLCPIQVNLHDDAAPSNALQKVKINPELSPHQKNFLSSLLLDFKDCFAASSKVGRTPVAKHRIVIDSATPPVCQRPYCVSPKEREAIRTQVDEMLADDVIQPSTSPWASPVVLVKKKDNTLRFCVDYRKLNNVTKKDVYPLPRIDDAIDRLRDARFFSSLDLKSGYWQIEVDERDREKTAFVTPDGLYEFKVLPFGLCSAPAIFQRMMDTVLAGLKWQTCLVYLDDVVIFSSSFEQHLQRLRIVLQALQSAQLTIKPEKCHFAFEELRFLGHVVSAQGVLPDPDKTSAVSSFPRSTDKKALRRFLGLCSYYRHFVKDFSRLAEPLTALTRDDTPFVWGSAQDAAFEELRCRLQSPPILAHFDENAETDVHTDASNVGLGAILVQWQDGAERVIAYASRTLSRSERNYSTTEKECLAVIWALSDYVWVWTPVRCRGLSEKLLRRYFAPYLVVRRLSDVTYEVAPASPARSSHNGKRSDVVHVVRMKPYYERPPRVTFRLHVVIFRDVRLVVYLLNTFSSRYSV